MKVFKGSWILLLILDTIKIPLVSAQPMPTGILPPVYTPGFDFVGVSKLYLLFIFFFLLMYGVHGITKRCEV